jgi:Zn-dependent peptidase ImmA (M78 family)
MQLISTTLNLPQSFFLRPVSQRLHDNGLFWRSMSSATKAARVKTQRRFGWLKDIVAYLKEYLDFPEVRFPNPKDLGVPDNPLDLTGDQIEEIANRCRSFWGLSDLPIADFVLFLENNGVVVSRGTLEAEKLDAFSHFCKASVTPYVFLTADKDNAVRSRLDAAHELGHLILHSKVQDRQIAHPQTYKLLETQAFRFGGAFLLPAHSFINELWSPTLDALRSLKERWRVSIGAMIKRCSDLELIDEPQDHRLWANYNRRGWKKKEPLDDKLIPEQPRLLKRCFDLLIDSGVKTREQILLDLPLSPKDITTLAALPEGYFSPDFGELRLFPMVKPKDSAQGGVGTVVPFNRGNQRK